MYNEFDENKQESTGGKYSSNYQGYRYSNTYPNDFNTRNAEAPAPEPPKKKSGFFKKAVAGILIGAFVGISAGVCFYIVNNVTEKETLAIEETTQGNQAEKGTLGLQVSNSGISSTGQVSAVVTDVTDVVEKVMPSVVAITNQAVITENYWYWGQQFQTEKENESRGSGIIVGENDTELLIVTNNHVVAGNDTLTIQFIDGTTAEARIKGTDAEMDLAVVAVKLSDLSEATRQSISIAVLGDSDSLKLGEPAIAIGNALGYGQSVTTGVISALNRKIAISEAGNISGDLIQTDAAINQGNSGGALLNVKGEVIGINSSKIGGSLVEGMGFSIPISNAKPIIEELMNRETRDKVEVSKKGYLGISGLDVTADVSNMYGFPEGVYVAQLYDGAAKKAGMQKGDIITEVAGTTISSMKDLQKCLEYYEAGETVTVIVQRPIAGEYSEQTLLVVLGHQVTTTETK